MSELGCRKCGSKNTVVCKVKDAAKKDPSAGFESQTSGFASASFAAEIIEAIKYLSMAVAKIFGFMEEKEKNEALMVVCKDCNYWERI